MGDFARWLSENYDVSIVMAQGVESKFLVGEFQNVPIDAAIEAAAKRVGLSARLSGGIYYVGQLGREDRGVLVRRVRRISGEEVTAAVTTVLSENGQLAAFEDGLLVCSDTVAVLQRVGEMIDGIESASRPSWVVQVFVVSFAGETLSDIGVDVQPSAKVAAGLMGVPWTDSLVVNVDLEAALRLAVEDSEVELIAEPLLVLGDGESAKFDRTERIPYRETTVEDDGVDLRSVSSVEFLPVGFTIDVSLRETGERAAVLKLNLVNSVVKDQLEDLPPTTINESFESRVPIQSGGVYLVGSYEAQKTLRSKRVGFGFRDQKERRVYQVWVRSYSIEHSKTGTGRDPLAGGASSGPPAVYEKPVESKSEFAPRSNQGEFIPSFPLGGGGDFVPVPNSSPNLSY